MRLASLSPLMVSLLLVWGCEETMRAPPPPADGAAPRDAVIAPPPPSDSSARDSGMDGGGTDGGGTDGATDSGPDAGLPPGCFVAGMGTATDAVLMSGGVSYPFVVNRSFATWDTALCLTVPTVIVGLTEGTCMPSTGDQLIFSLAEASINTTITVGTNTLLIEPDDLGLTVRFRSTGAGGGGEEWGTCDGASGSVTFSNLGSVVGERLTATYDMTLSDCRPPFDSPPIEVSGSFDLPLEVSLESVCL